MVDKSILHFRLSIHSDDAPYCLANNSCLTYQKTG